MSQNETKIWLGRGKDKYGPYSEASVRQWILEGKLAGSDFAWRSGMSGWVTVATMFPEVTLEPPLVLSTSLPRELASEKAISVAAVSKASGKAEPSPAEVFKKNRTVAVFVVGIAAVLGIVLYVAVNRDQLARSQLPDVAQNDTGSPQVTLAAPVSQTTADTEMSDQDIQRCEVANHVAVRTAEITARIYGQDYATQRAAEDLKKRVSPACLARLAREDSEQRN